MTKRHLNAQQAGWLLGSSRKEHRETEQRSREERAERIRKY